MKLSIAYLPLSGFSDTLTLLFSLLAVVFVLYLSYLFSKYMANKVNNVSKSSNIRVLERVALSPDKGLVIIQICEKYYLVGFASNTIEILKELDEAELNFPKSALKESFLEALQSTLKSRWDVKMSDRNNHAAAEADDAAEKEKRKNQ
jgi:flagellar protein FliO/FliZ